MNYRVMEFILRELKIHSPQLGRVVSIATLPTGGQVFVVTHAVTFGLSPRRSLAFIDELKARVKIARDPA